MMHPRSLSRLAVALALVVGLAACGDDDGAGVRDVTPTNATGAASGSASASAVAPDGACTPVGEELTTTAVVELDLVEYAITVDPPTVPAGVIHLEAHNEGALRHEIVVVRAASAAELPTTDEGSFAEDEVPAGTVLGEIEPFGAGLTCDGSFELAAGSYVLLCNLVDVESDAFTAHFANGMMSVLTVE